MTPFLKQVADHYYTDGNLGRLCFVFPNKRSGLFFKKYLAGTVAEAGGTQFAPKVITINEFFYALTGSVLTDRLQLLYELWNCYCKLTPRQESLDEFLYWGGVILSDFDDVDKYLADPRMIFSNIAELKGMQDDFSWLDEGQRDAIRHFISLFEKDGGYKGEFRKIWDILYPLYKSFNEALAAKGLCYEGMVYRKLAESLEDTPVADLLQEKFEGKEKFVFTGLNALNKCERKVLAKMRDAGFAEFCWDYSSNEIKDPQNKSSHFLGEFSQIYPQAFKPDPEGLGKPVINALSVSSAVGQAKQLPAILQRLRSADGSAAETDIETAVVLPDEGLLLPVLNSIPPEVPRINVTMGYPIRGSEFLSMMNDIAALQVHLRESEGKISFYHRQVWGLFSNSVFRRCLSEEEKANCGIVRENGKYYIPESELVAGEVSGLIFRKAGDDIASYQKAIITAIAPLLKGSLEQEFAMVWYKALTRLENLHLDIKPRTWYRLLMQLASGESVPFKGEPLAGMQVLGPLETRALDFKNLIILSFNEGIFPRHNVASSFIPAEIRKGFDLPTYEHQDAIWAYYFYRLIQRAENVWLVSDSRTDVSRSGEESRYLKQLEMLYGFDIHRYVMKAEQKTEDRDIIQDLPRTQEDIELLHGKMLSATALQDYINCPAKFYFGRVRGLKATEEVAEALDSGMIGRIVHSAMQNLYSKPPFFSENPVHYDEISADFLKGLLSEDDKRIPLVVDYYIRKEMKSPDISGRNLVFRELILKYVRRIISTDLELLHGRKSFKCFGLEDRKFMEIGGFRFIGFIDRLDSFEPGMARIVDYKTGSVKDEDININPDNAENVVKALFEGKYKDRPKIALQLYLYDRFLKGDPRISGYARMNCLYQTGNLFTDGPLSSVVCPEFNELMDKRIDELLERMDKPEGNWERTADTDTCTYCDFKKLCGR